MALRSSRLSSRSSGTSSRAYEKALTAAAERIVDRTEKVQGSGVQLGEPWQREFWKLYRRVPEMRSAAEITGQAMRQCRLVIARPSETGGEPSPLNLAVDEKTGEPKNPEDYNHPAVQWLRIFAGGLLGQADMQEKAGQLFVCSGEGVFVGALDPNVALRNPANPFLRMQLYSEQQVQVQAGGQIVVRTEESAQANRTVVEGDKDTMTAVRTWRPDTEFDWRADSAGKAALPILREIAMMDSHIRSSAISRLVSAGLLLVPDGMQLPGKAADDNDPDADIDPFMRLMMELFSLAIQDPDSAAAMVPILLRGSREDLEAMRHLLLNTPFDDKVSGLRKDAIGRLGTTVDMPGEILTGYGALQHWTGALITEEWKGTYLPKFMGSFCSSLTTGLMYPHLAKQDPNAPADVIVWFDDSGVRTRENTGPEAQGAYDRGEIDGPAYRRKLGFDESDVPKGDELTKQLAQIMLIKAPAMAPILFPILGITLTEDQLTQAALLKDLVGNMGAPPGGTGDLPTEGGTGQIPGSGSKPGEQVQTLEALAATLAGR